MMGSDNCLPLALGKFSAVAPHWGNTAAEEWNLGERLKGSG
jgi:hypothetical protein